MKGTHQNRDYEGRRSVHDLVDDGDALSHRLEYCHCAPEAETRPRRHDPFHRVVEIQVLRLDLAR